LGRVLVVDEDLSKRIQTELNRRGRTAKSIASLGLKGLTDPDVLQRLHDIDPDCVLISGDNAMPASHAADLARFRTTLAIVAPYDASSGLTPNAWEHEIVQKWVHRIESQPRGSIRRYTLSGGRAWKPSKRPDPTGF
jgi:hypothetical protein